MDMWKKALAYMTESKMDFDNLKESIENYNAEHGTHYCLAVRNEEGLEEV